MRTNTVTLHERYLGALLGLACGDAVGTTVEFSARGSFEPMTDMIGGGPFRLQAGQWTDDTAMALCLAESLLTKQAFDAHDQMARYLNWWRWGYMSCTGNCFDIGMTVQRALLLFETTGAPYCGSPDPYSAGNGSLMRLVPVVLFAYPDMQSILKYAADSSRTTHGAEEAIESCQLFASILSAILVDMPKAALLENLIFTPRTTKLAAITTGSFRDKTEIQIRGSGYCVESLEAALWCFYTTNNFEQAILRAANLGDDADTTAAITGQLAGAYYGVNGIPQHWLDKLAMRDDITDMASRLYARMTSASNDEIRLHE
jgi:ADP-ribosyl-[dinitrogen reductase] hydrolase